jgi:hypothetical protein
MGIIAAYEASAALLPVLPEASCMTCKSCAERRAKWKKKLAEKKAKRQGVQAAGITAALAITELGGKVLGISDGSDSQQDEQPGPSDVGDPEG